MGSEGIRPPRVGDEVRYQGEPATVLVVHRQGASYVPGHLVMPVDLQINRGHIRYSTSMTPHGVNSGWSWPSDAPAMTTATQTKPTEAPRD